MSRLDTGGKEDYSENETTPTQLQPSDKICVLTSAPPWLQGHLIRSVSALSGFPEEEGLSGQMYRRWTMLTE